MQSEIDWQTFNEIQALMEDGFSEFLKAFMTNTEMHIQNIPQAINSEDYKALRMSAHTIKSSARTLGMNSLSNKAGHLEKIAQEYENKGDSAHGDMVETLYKQIEEEFKMLSPDLESKLQTNY